MPEMAKCQWCGDLHGPMCPHVKAIEYVPSGGVKRVEFKCASDYYAPLNVMGYGREIPCYTPDNPRPPPVTTNEGAYALDAAGVPFKRHDTWMRCV